MPININKVQAEMLNKTQQKPLKKQNLSHTQKKWQPQIWIFLKTLKVILF